MRHSLERKVGLLFILVAAITIFVGAMTYQIVAETTTNDWWVEHTHKVHSRIDRIGSLIANAESGLRGYVITGDDRFLDQYRAAVPQFDHEVEWLQKATADNPRQQAHLGRLQERIAQKSAQMNEMIQIRARGGFAPASAAVLGGQGRSMMEGVRVQLDRMAAEEEGLLAVRVPRALASSRKLVAIVVMGSTASVLILVLVFYLIGRESTRRTLAEAALRRSEEEATKLSMVASRTSNAVAICDRDGRTEWINAGFHRMTGWDTAEVVGKPLWPLIHGPDSDRLALDQLAAAVGGDREFHAEILHYARGGRKFWADVEVQPLVDPGAPAPRFVAILTDVTARRQSDERLAAQHAASKILAGAPALDDAMPRLLAAFGEELGCEVAEFWQVDPASAALRLAGKWASSTQAQDDFCREAANLQITQGVGLAGRVWATGRPAWIDDLLNDPNFVRRDAAARVGLGHGFGFPIE